MPWTDAELAEMAAADAEIEADEAGTYAFVSALAGMDADLDNDGTVIDPDIRRARDYQRRYYEANKDEIKDYQRRYREANKDEIKDRQRRYREAKKERPDCGNSRDGRKGKSLNLIVAEERGDVKWNYRG